MNQQAGRFAFFRQLMADGITCMFGNPGSSEENLLDALQHEEFKGFKYYMALQEGPAVAMADAHARATRQPAIVQLHSYAGLANGLGMMYYAKRGYSPLVIIAGEAGLQYEALDGQMSADLVTMARPFVKSDYNGPCAWRVVHAGSLLRLLRRAIKAAATPPFGPVFLALPMDVLEEVNTERVMPSTIVNTKVGADPKVIHQAAQLLATAKRPLILMGDGIAASSAQEELSVLANLLQADVYGVNNSEVNIRSSHLLYKGDTGHMFGADSRTITSQADVILITGTTVMPEVFPLLEGVFAEDASILQFDLNAYEIAKNFPVKIAALADPKLALGALINEIKSIQALNNINNKEIPAPDNKESSDNDSSLLSAFAQALKSQLSETDTVFFDEALTNSPALFNILGRDYEKGYYQTRAGMLGTGLPGTIGLKVANPDKTVIGFVGDGGAISTIQALNTAARYNIAAKFVICNNRSYRILKYNINRYRQDLGIDLSTPFPAEFDLSGLDFVQLAEGHGVKGARIETVQQIAPVIKKALAEDGPFLIELILDQDL